MTFVITAGPTREFLDPVRFLSNPSTGRMGFAIARAARDRGHRVILVSGPVSLRTPSGVERVDAVSALDMYRAVRKAVSPDCVFVASAAVADWRPSSRAGSKLKKSEMDGTLRLTRNPDILKSVRSRVKIGFAAETGDPAHEAARKLREKRLDMIVANDVCEKGAGFAVATNKVVFIKKDGETVRLPVMDKLAIARKIVREAERIYTENA